MNSVSVQLDHIFLFVNSRRRAEQMMKDAGLRVNYSRAHPGQGTTNLCACLDDVFLELLWLDGTPISDESTRVTLAARGRGEGLPLGIAWRGNCPLETQPYAAPFLPHGEAIPVATASADLSVPFVFESPGGVPPIERTDGLPGARQAPRFATLQYCRIGLADHLQTLDLLKPFDIIEVIKSKVNFVEFAICGPADDTEKTVLWQF